MLQLLDTHVDVAGKPLLKSISMEIVPGSVCGLFGFSGSGRSSIIKLFCQQKLPTKGNVVLDGNTLVNQSPNLCGIVGYVPQGAFLPPDINVGQMLGVFNDLGTGEVGFERFKDMRGQSIRSLSGGERRFIEVMGILNLKRKYYVLDEPFSGIQPIDVEIISGIIAKRTKEGAGILIADQYYKNVVAIAGYGYVLKDNTCFKIKNSESIEEKLVEFGYIRKRP